MSVLETFYSTLLCFLQFAMCILCGFIFKKRKRKITHDESEVEWFELQSKVREICFYYKTFTFVF